MLKQYSITIISSYLVYKLTFYWCLKQSYPNINRLIAQQILHKLQMNKTQQSISVGSKPSVLQWPPPDGSLRVNKFEQVSIVGHQVPVAGGLEMGGPRSDISGWAWGWRPCAVRSKASWVMVTWGHPVDRQNGRHIRLKTSPSCYSIGGR